MIWLVVWVWLVCVGVLLHLHFEVRRTRYQPPEKWEPYTEREVEMWTSGTPLAIRAEVPEGMEAEAAEMVLRLDLAMSKAGR